MAKSKASQSSLLERNGSDHNIGVALQKDLILLDLNFFLYFLHIKN